MLFLLSLVVQLEVGRENPDQQIQHDEPAFERHDSHPYQRLLSHWRRPRESTLREIPEDSSDNDYEAFSIPSSKSVDSSATIYRFWSLYKTPHDPQATMNRFLCLDLHLGNMKCTHHECQVASTKYMLRRTKLCMID